MRTGIISLLFILLGCVQSSAAPVCQDYANLNDPFAFYTHLAETFLPIDDVITAVARNTSLCSIMGDKTCKITVNKKKQKIHSCFPARENAYFGCKDGKAPTIGENVRDSVKGTGSLKLCYRGIKEIVERLYGPQVRAVLTSQYAKNAGNDFNKLKKFFTKVPVNSAEAKQAGSICVLSGNKYGHIEMQGSDGNVYSDFNQGPRSIAGNRYRKTACYAPTEEAKTTLRFRLAEGLIKQSDLVMPMDGGPLGEDQQEESLDAN